MAGSRGSPESFGSPFSDLVSPRFQHQSREEVTANLSKRLKKTTTARGESAPRGGTAAPLPAAVNFKLAVKRAKIQKKKHGEGEEKTTSSPTRRKEAQSNRQAPMTSNRRY
jgi:hypothetical protein